MGYKVGHHSALQCALQQVQDQVAAQFLLLEHLGISKVHACARGRETSRETSRGEFGESGLQPFGFSQVGSSLGGGGPISLAARDSGVCYSVWRHAERLFGGDVSRSGSRLRGSQLSALAMECACSLLVHEQFQLLAPLPSDPCLPLSRVCLLGTQLMPESFPVPSRGE